MNKYKFKAWVKSKNKSYWVFTGVITFFIILAIAALFIAMHMCGYTFTTWMAKFYPWVIVVGCVLALLIIAYVLYKLRRK